jgi:aryl-alcohol dehydrogenase-like predicted oxidoreductase
MTEFPAMQRLALAPGYEISRVIRGGWQLSSGHGESRSDDPVGDMVAFADAGITTFDCADIYTGVEDLIGRFRLRYRELRGAEALRRIRVHTKCVPDLTRLHSVTRPYIEDIIDTSLRRLQLERLDLVQFHWWDYTAPRWLEVAHWLDDIRRAGKIERLSGTNFDTEHLLAMCDGGIPLTSMQIQYSLLDARPQKRMVQAGLDHGVALFCYGTVAGGFLGDAWLGRPEPQGPFENRSLTKYKLIIDDIGGWEFFQALLSTLRQIADRHGVDISTVASAAMLTRPAVGAVIVGARSRAHLAANLAVGSLALTAGDHAQIEAVLADAKPLGGDVFGLERDRTSRHGSIMKYNLNQGAA